MNNDAFADHQGSELARILRSLADQVDGDSDIPIDSQNIRDVNGNAVGFSSVSGGNFSLE